MAMSKPSSSTSRSNVARIERMYERHSLTASDVVGAAGEESIGQTHGTELEAPRRERLAALADQHLGRAAADVDQDQPLLERRHAPAARRGGSAGLPPARRSPRCRPWPRGGPGSGTRRSCAASRTALVATARTVALCAAAMRLHAAQRRRCRGRSRRSTAPSCRRRRGRGARFPSRG